MKARWLTGRTSRLLLAPLLGCALIGAAPGPASASPAGPWTRVATPNPGTAINGLLGVAAVSPHLAWAVGGYSNIGPGGGSLIMRWNGTSWKQQPSFNPRDPYNSAGFYDVAATSPANAWAVGIIANGLEYQTLTVHWDGTAWKRVPSPNPGGYASDILQGVAATSPTNAWAVGQYLNGTGNQQTLIVHWDGTAWTHVPSPTPGYDSTLLRVAATSPTNAWAVGYYGGFHALIEHWDGTAWTLVPSPDGSHDANFLYGVAATSPANAWAVGESCAVPVCTALILHWDGTTWTRIPSPQPASATQLYGVAATSPTDAWAVGHYGSGHHGLYYTLVLRWDGTAWSQVHSPNPPEGKLDTLYAVSANSPGNVWAVGDYYNHVTTVNQTLALHCCRLRRP